MVTYIISPLCESHVEACSLLEANAFNQLRKEWGQPLQPPRRQDWLLYHTKKFPYCNNVALANNRVVGFCISHKWGSLGWIGPITVEPTFQGHGIGQELTKQAIQKLIARNCQIIGLETWPHRLPNIALYLKNGFNSGPLIFIFEKKITDVSNHFTGFKLSNGPSINQTIEGLTGLFNLITPGLDYSPLVMATLDCHLGSVYVWGSIEKPKATAIVHYETYLEEPSPNYAKIELFIVQPGKESIFDCLLEEVEGLAANAGRTSIRISLSSHHADGLRHLMSNGYRLHKSRIRMYFKKQPIKPEYINYMSFAV